MTETFKIKLRIHSENELYIIDKGESHRYISNAHEYRMTVQERIQLSRRWSAGQLCYSCMNLLESKAFLAFSKISSVQWLYMFSVVVTSA